MPVDPTLIGAVAALVMASALAFVQVSKELREWRKKERRRARSVNNPAKAQSHGD